MSDKYRAAAETMSVTELNVKHHDLLTALTSRDPGLVAITPSEMVELQSMNSAVCAELAVRSGGSASRAGVYMDSEADQGLDAAEAMAQKLQEHAPEVAASLRASAAAIAERETADAIRMRQVNAEMDAANRATRKRTGAPTSGDIDRLRSVLDGMPEGDGIARAALARRIQSDSNALSAAEQAARASAET